MADAEIGQVLAATPLCASLTQEERNRLVSVGRVEYWREGALVVEEGDDGPRMMFLLEGVVEVLRRDAGGVQRVIAELHPGDVLGETSLLLDLPRTATVKATTSIRCFTLDRSSFYELVEAGDPAVLKLGLALSRTLAERLMKLNEQVVSLLSDAEQSDGPLHGRFGEARQQLFKLWDY